MQEYYNIFIIMDSFEADQKSDVIRHEICTLSVSNVINHRFSDASLSMCSLGKRLTSC